MLQAGDVLLISGDMGAGKSEFCRGLARGLGIGGPIPSPSFTILNLYEEGRLPFKHFDWYRVEGEDELLAAGLDEMLGGEGITAIEWHGRAPGLLPPDSLEITLTGMGESTRRIAFQAHGAFRALPYNQLPMGEGIRPC